MQLRLFIVLNCECIKIRSGYDHTWLGHMRIGKLDILPIISLSRAKHARRPYPPFLGCKPAKVKMEGNKERSGINKSQTHCHSL